MRGPDDDDDDDADDNDDDDNDDDDADYKDLIGAAQCEDDGWDQCGEAVARVDPEAIAGALRVARGEAMCVYVCVCVCTSLSIHYHMLEHVSISISNLESKKL